MGKAALDLPDPLQAPPEGPKASTDDLLSQLAGEEIDRLLAEADADQPAVTRAPFHVGPPAEGEDEAPVPAAAAVTPTNESVPAPTAKGSPAEAEVAAEMDALFSAAAAKDAELENAAAQVIADAAVQAESETTAAERAGLQVPAGVAAPADAAPAPGAAEDDDDRPLPLYLRPLEWINAPLALLPEGVRDFVGKAAIVTLVNAAVILAYVLIARRGH